MIPKIQIRLSLFTEMGPAGMRLQRKIPLPISSFDFPDTPEGRSEAEIAREQLQNYVGKYHVPRREEK
jgi:hypothetical protein